MNNRILNLLESRKQKFIKIKEIVYEKENPKRENFETLLSSMRNNNFTYIYLLVGKKEKCEIYLGCLENKKIEISANSYVEDILEPIFNGIFKGSKTELLEDSELEEELIYFLTKNKRESKLYGVPTYNKPESSEKFQYIDTIINSMAGAEYCMGVFFESCSNNEIKTLELDLNKKYEKLSEIGKVNIQTSKSSGTNDTKSRSENKSTNKSKSDTQTKSENNGSERSSSSKSIAKADQSSDTVSNDVSSSTSTSENTSESRTREKIEKEALNQMKKIDDVLFPRLNTAKNRGIFKVKTYLTANNAYYLERLENIVLSLYQGDEANLKELRIEKGEFKENLELTLEGKAQGEIFNYLTTKELSLMIGLPKKEVVGVEINQGVDFGLNIPEIKAKNRIELGKLLNRGLEVNKKVSIDKKELNKHIFIAGVTGAGKTTTAHNLLRKADLPFLVIEPAKTEYRELIGDIKDLKIYTLGDEETIPFRINPFEFLETENITSHVDMLKASFEASFDMEAAIPQLLEAAIYKSYEEYGWDIDDNSNVYLENRKDAWNTGGIYFPTLEDLIRNVEKVVDEQGFDDRLKKDYLGSIKARLQSLLIGSKGQMLNTRVSIDFEKLLKEKVVLELEEIKSGVDKSLIIALILVRLCETLKAMYIKNPDFRHITLIEEAHRLLAKISPGESPNKKQAIELFTDMLAEVRKYGESLIIADQIPNKLASEVLKNTNTKIIHKLFAKDDKEAVGDTMSMNEEQKNYLSNLGVGETIIFSQNWKKGVHVKISQMSNTTGKLMSSEELKDKLRKNILEENLISFYPESIFLNEGRVEELDSYKKEYKKLLRYFNKGIQDFKKGLESSSEEVKRYFIYKLLLTKKAIRVKENTREKLEKEYETFIKKIDSAKDSELKEYINKILK